MNALRWTLLLFLVLPIATTAQGPGVFALRTMLQDKAPEVRMKAAEGLGRVGGRQGVIILRQGLADKNATVRIAVVEALGFIGGRLSMAV
ncbi:MAG TPA: HEAT repeat domain-containing protein, partial [Candidatus Latescibacteria bacterium]|nr:HEAT repeat domain-containing protein [Candidatus Latescibacterota bacterium]